MLTIRMNLTISEEHEKQNVLGRLVRMCKYIQVTKRSTLTVEKYKNSIIKTVSRTFDAYAFLRCWTVLHYYEK